MRVRQTSQTVTGGRRSRDACFILCAGDAQAPEDFDWSGPLDAPRYIPAGSTMAGDPVGRGLQLGPTQRVTDRP